MTIKEIIENLRSSEREIIFDMTEYLQNMFDSYYDIDEDDFVIIMNLLVESAVKFKDDHELFLQLMETLELGVGRRGTEHVIFEPLIQILHEKQFESMWRIIIILGFSQQPMYIKVLKGIKTNDIYLQKEIKEAIYELESVKY